MKTVGERIRQAREARGLSQTELATKAGFKHQSAIGNLEGRATGRGGFRLAQIAAALDVPVEWLLNGPDMATPPNRSTVREDESQPYRALSDVDRAVSIVRRLPDRELREALSFLQFLEARTTPSEVGADHSVSAPPQRASK